MGAKGGPRLLLPSGIGAVGKPTSRVLRQCPYTCLLTMCSQCSTCSVGCLMVHAERCGCMRVFKSVHTLGPKQDSVCSIAQACLSSEASARPRRCAWSSLTAASHFSAHALHSRHPSNLMSCSCSPGVPAHTPRGAGKRSRSISLGARSRPPKASECAHARTHTHARTHARMHPPTRAHTHTHTHTHTRAHTQTTRGVEFGLHHHQSLHLCAHQHHSA